jgi:hypothetical protein
VRLTPSSGLTGEDTPAWRRWKMRLLPVFGLSLLHGGLLLGAYFIGLSLSVLTFPKEKRRKLFLNLLGFALVMASLWDYRRAEANR